MKALPKIAVLASGRGSNLEAIIAASANGSLPVAVRLVVSDKKDALALERARTAGIEALWVSPKDFPAREEFDAALVKELKAREVDWIILAGFMRILTKTFVSAFRGKILNIHPSLLPKYPGIHSIERAFEAGEKEVGVTVHFVDEGVDTGPMILQEAIPVRNGETLEGLTARVHQVEHRLYPEAIRKVINE